jgi:hypothetical protein
LQVNGFNINGGLMRVLTLRVGQQQQRLNPNYLEVGRNNTKIQY